MYIVEGNIGVGKSTFLRLIQAQLPYVSVVFEPVYNWQSQTQGESILANFYEDPHRWAYTMETVAMRYRVKEHLNEQQNSYPFRVMERSIYSGHYIFAKNGYKAGFLNDLEWKIYNDYFSFLVEGNCKPPHGFIYLKGTPEVSYERIKKRKRSAETTISLDYIKQIHDCHEALFLKKIDMLADLKSVPILTIDCDEEFELEPDTFSKHARALERFMQADKLGKDKNRHPIDAFQF